MKENVYVVEGEVVDNLPNTMFRVQLGEEHGSNTLLCYLSGKMRKNYIKILPGDRVRVELTSYDNTRGRIVYRL